jgi:hypothetical protein
VTTASRARETNSKRSLRGLAGDSARRAVTSRRLACGALGVLGLVVYLWPAIVAPAVLWSDSYRDLEWARAGIGILSPAPIPTVPHPAKPFFILFLKIVLAFAPVGCEPRAIIVIQSLLVWIAIGAVALFVGKRISPGRGAFLYVVLLGLLRLRDASSAVMAEALSAAMFLVLLVPMLDSPRGFAGPALLGLGTGALFLVRPNEGASAAALAVLAWWLARRWRPSFVFAGTFFALVLPVWVATAPSQDAWRGMSPAFAAAAAEYDWIPAEGLPSPTDPADARREFRWRWLHGVFGTEYYDARWSPTYRSMSELSRVLTPWLIVAAIAVVVTAPSNARNPARVLGLALVAILVVQSYVLGALPRFALPMLPGLFLFAAATPSEAAFFGARRGLLAVAVFAVLSAGLAAHSEVLDWEWGKVEAAGVRIVQPIPRGALPRGGPATLHIRIGPPLLPTGAGVAVRGPDGRLLYETPPSSERRRPFVTVPLPDSLLARDRTHPVDLTIEATGYYDPTHFLLYPVVPPPWGAARREGNAELSPDSGITRGGLDWWAHEGER